MANKITTVLDLDDRGFKKSIGDMRRSIAEADGATNKFKAGAASLGTTLKANAGVAAVAAGAAIAAFGAKAVSAASDLEESTNAVEKSYGAAAKAVLALGDNSAESVGLSQAAFNDAAVSFAGFAKQLTGSAGTTADILGTLTQRSADFASVMNMDVTEAANTFRSALSGEQEPIKKFGIDMSAAAVEAYALANGLADSKAEMTEAVKVQSRYGLLLESTNQYAGDFADTSDGLANSSRILSAKMTDLSASVGEKLTPSVIVAVEWAIKLLDVIDSITNLPGMQIPIGIDLEESNEGLAKFKQSLQDQAAGLTEAEAAYERYGHGVAQTMIQASIDQALNAQSTENWKVRQEEATEASEAAWEDWGESVEAAGEAAIDNYEAQVEAANEWGDGIREQFDSGIQGMLEVGDTSEMSARQFIDAQNAKTAAAHAHEQNLRTVLETVRREMVATGQITDEQAVAMVASYAEMGEGAAGVVEDVAAGEVPIADAFNAYAMAASVGGDGMIAGLDPVADGMAAKMKAADAALAWELALSASLASFRAAKIGTNITEGVKKGLIDGQGSLNAQVRNMINQALAAAESAGEIESPSELFAREVGVPIVEGVEEGIVREGDKIGDALAKAIEDAEADAVEAAEDLVDTVGDALDGFWDGLDSSRSEDALRERVSDAERGVADATDNLNEVLADSESTSEDVADAREKLSDATTTLEDANYRLLKATADMILVDEQSRESWIATAEQAGLTRQEIDGLVAAYLRLAAAKAEAAGIAAAASSAASRASLVNADFSYAVKQGWIKQNELDMLSGMGSAQKIDWMASKLNDLQRWFGFDVKAYAQGGVVPGHPSQGQLAIVHGGETITPAGQGMSAAEMSKAVSDGMVAGWKRVQQIGRAS